MDRGKVPRCPETGTKFTKGDTWFRDNRVYGYFDRLIADGFFEDFDTVIFYGAGSCGYAAAAFSVAAPGPL